MTHPFPPSGDPAPQPPPRPSAPPPFTGPGARPWSAPQVPPSAGALPAPEGYYAAGWPQGAPGQQGYPPNGYPPGSMLPAPYAPQNYAVAFPGAVPIPQLGAPSGGEEGLHLKDYLRVVAARRWLALGVFALVFLFAAVRTFRSQPIYEARATLRIEQGTPKILGVDDLQSGAGADRQRFYDTQYKLLRTRSLAEKTLDSLRLVEPFIERARVAEPSWSDSAVAWSREALGAKSPLPDAAQLPPEERGRQAAVDWLLANLSIRPEPNSELVHLIFASPYPDLCARVSNELARQFIDANIADRSSAYRSAGASLRSEVEAALQRLEEMETRMREYAGGRDQLALETRRQIADKRLEGLGQSLAEAERALLDKKALMDQAATDARSSPLAQADPAVLELTALLNKQIAEHERLAAEYGEKYPPLQQAIRDIEATRRRLDSAHESIVRAASSAYNLSLENYTKLKGAYDEQQKFVTELEDSLVQYRLMAQQAASERESYQRLLDRQKEISIQEGLATNNARLVEEASAPFLPTYPRVGRNLALAALAGLLLGVVACFFVEYMDRSVKSNEDVEQHVGLPVLATIPNLGGPTVAMEDGTKIPVALVSALMPGSPHAERFRYLRTSIVYSMAGQVPQVVMLSSAQPGEGKTTVTINTASAFAQRGKKVLVIDGDLKRPACHTVFGLDRRLGLTAVLTGQCELEDAIFPTRAPGLDFMPAGPIAPNPADLLDSPRMRELIRGLRERYDHIFIDSAPLAGMADSYVISSLSDGVILVIEAGRTARELARAVRVRLQAVGARTLGAVVNARRARHRGGVSDGYAYGYGYGYGYDYGGRAPEIAATFPATVPSTMPPTPPAQPPAPVDASAGRA